MMIKCLGGSRDGYIYNSPARLRVGDTVLIPEIPKAPVNFTIDYYENLKSITTKNHLYELRVLYFSRNDPYYFLVPHGWTDKQALLHQFGK